jgi:hypothetical protein
MSTPTKTKRIILDYKNNPDLEEVILRLESLYPGMSKAEIVKLALVELFKHNDGHQKNIQIVQLTDEEEMSLEKAYASGWGEVLETPEDITNFLNKLADEDV